MSDKILVLNGESYASAVKDIGPVVTDMTEFLHKPTDFRCVLFTGGEDVSPELYDDASPKGYCHNNELRDKVEQNVFKLAYANNIAMAGICRGIQFLNVMAGGKLIHHLDGHSVGKSHLMTTTIQEAPILVNSLHHQAVIPPDDAVIIGWSTVQLSKKYIGFQDHHINYDGKEIEAMVIPKYNIFAVQYHPEMMSEDSTGYIFFNAGLTTFLEMGADEFVKEFRYGEQNGTVQA